MSELRSTMGVFANQCYQILRTEGFYAQGVYQRTMTNTTWGRGNIQPASQRDVERLPEGARADGAVTLFTLDQLKTTESPNSVADRILVNGTEYEVSSGEYWPSHNRYLCTKVGQ